MSETKRMKVRNHRWIGAAAVAAVAVSSGCSSESQNTEPLPPVISLSDEARQAMSDGVVTRAEIEGARARTIACFAAEGFRASFIREDDRVSTLNAFSGLPKPGETEAVAQARFNAVTSHCTSEFLDPVDMAWLRSEAPSDDELRAAWTAVQQCVGPFGLDVVSPDAKGLADALRKIDDPTAPEAEVVGIKECLSTYAVATASGERS
jgi:hypothetical protein